jgi:hypothetical protein
MDDVDMSLGATDIFLRESLTRRKPVVLVRATGVCLNAGCDMSTEHRWCSAECRDDWEASQTAINYSTAR